MPEANGHKGGMARELLLAIAFDAEGMALCARRTVWLRRQPETVAERFVPLSGDDAVERLRAAAAAVRAFVADLDARPDRIALVLPPGETLDRHERLPRQALENIEWTVRHQVERRMPFPAERAAWAWSIVPAPGAAVVLGVSALPRERLELYRTWLAELELDAEIVVSARCVIAETVAGQRGLPAHWAWLTPERKGWGFERFQESRLVDSGRLPDWPGPDSPHRAAWPAGLRVWGDGDHPADEEAGAPPSLFGAMRPAVRHARWVWEPPAAGVHQSNFLGDNQRRRAERGRQALTALAIAVLLLALLRFGLLIAAERRVIDDLEARHAPIAEAAEEARGLAEEIRAGTERLADYDNVRGIGPSPLEIWYGVTEATPGDSWVRELKIDPERVEIVGFAPASAPLISAYQRLGLLDNVEFAAPVKRQRGQEQFRIEAVPAGVVP